MMQSNTAMMKNHILKDMNIVEQLNHNFKFNLKKNVCLAHIIIISEIIIKIITILIITIIYFVLFYIFE